MKTIIELANELADLRVMAARGQCVTSDEVADAYKALEKAIAAARVAALEEAAKECDRTASDYKGMFAEDESLYIAATDCAKEIRKLITGQ